MPTQKNYYFLFTNLFFLTMAIFAIVFANERFQADGAYYLFKVVDYGEFRVEHQRFILAVSQVLPLLGSKLGLSMQAIIILNSLNNVVFFYLVFLYAVYYLKDKTAGTGVILFMVFGVLHIQFTPMYEIWYGTILLVLVRSHMVQGRYIFMRDILFLGIIMITILFSHPLLFIPLLFILLFDALETWRVQWRMFFLTVIVFSVWYITKKLFLSSYEAGKLSLLDTSWNKAYLDLLHPGYYWKLFKFFFTWYTIPMIVYLVMMGYYLFRRARGKMILVSAFLIGHILLVNFTHVMDWELSPYFERMYMPIIPIIFLPFLYDFFTQLALRNKFGAFILLALIGWRIARFTSVGMMYKSRTELAKRVIDEAQKFPGSKFELNPADYRSCMRFVDWSFPMETLLRSAAEYPDHVVTIATVDDFDQDNNRRDLNEKDFMMTCRERMPDYSTNQKYFHLRNGQYQLLKPMCR